MINPLLPGSRILTPIRVGGVTGMVGYFGPVRRNRDGTEKMHKGIDLLAVEGWPVFAAHAGEVARAGKSESYGWVVYIRDSGMETRYAHLAGPPEVGQGDAVEAGQLIGKVGRSGNVPSNAPTHLHFEVRQDDTAVDPEAYIA
jgi:murein DD-endopeptidase MepM/ murein hydrolase activator NlpD